MVSGGGPGAMEATHLGAYFATREDGDLAEAIRRLSERPGGAEPGREYLDKDWLHFYGVSIEEVASISSPLPPLLFCCASRRDS